jgi:hypothetical protein
MAFLLLLERLTPLERAVLLLREVFEYDYPEIAKILAQTEANCRQILRRAKRHVGEMRRRFDASAQAQNDLLKSFLQAVRKGELEKLVELLASDVALYSDGGGKAIALPSLVEGAENVARSIFNSMSTLVPQEPGNSPRTNQRSAGICQLPQWKALLRVQSAWQQRSDPGDLCGDQSPETFSVAEPASRTTSSWCHKSVGSLVSFSRGAWQDALERGRR